MPTIEQVIDFKGHYDSCIVDIMGIIDIARLSGDISDLEFGFSLTLGPWSPGRTRVPNFADPLSDPLIEKTSMA